MKYNLIVLELTKNCNLSCKHCSVNDIKASEMTFIDYKVILDKIKKLKFKKIILSGGEPLLYEGFWKILEYLDVININVGITTNGLLINDNVIKKLKSFKSIQEVQVSIDGLKKNHEYIRGENTFDITISNIKKMIKNGIIVNTMTVLSPLNISELDKLTIYLKSIGINKIGFERFTPTGKGQNFGFRFSKQEHEKVYKKYLSLKSKFNIHVNDPIFNINHLNNNSINKYIPTSGCMAGISNFAINSIGELKLCTRLPHVLGSLLNNDFDSLTKNSELIKKLFIRDFSGKCKKCSNLMICGGCRANSFAINKDIFSEDPECWK